VNKTKYKVSLLKFLRV